MNLLYLYYLFAKIAVFTYGGGYAMIPLFENELVVKHAYLTSAEFANLVALAQITPGPIGLNAATYIGMLQGGFAGALAAMTICPQLRHFQTVTLSDLNTTSSSIFLINLR